MHGGFFDPGGTRWPIMRPLSDIQATFDREIPVRTVFSTSTLEDMAGEIERRIHEDVSTLSEFGAVRLAGSNHVAGA